MIIVENSYSAARSIRPQRRHHLSFAAAAAAAAVTALCWWIVASSRLTLSLRLVCTVRGCSGCHLVETDADEETAAVDSVLPNADLRIICQVFEDTCN